jgi:hypothetical protein
MVASLPLRVFNKAEKTEASQTEPRGIARCIPLLQRAPKYDSRWLRPDLIAGLTVAAQKLFSWP